MTVFGRDADKSAEILCIRRGRDALAYYFEGRVEVVIDWKSDVEIDAARLGAYQAHPADRHISNLTSAVAAVKTDNLRRE